MGNENLPRSKHRRTRCETRVWANFSKLHRFSQESASVWDLRVVGRDVDVFVLWVSCCAREVQIDWGDLAAVLARPLLDEGARVPVIYRDFRRLSTLSAVTRAPRPAPALHRRSSSQARGPDQGPTGSEHWLADVEARFAGEQHVTQSGSGANDPVAPISISRAAAAQRLDTTSTASADENDHPDVLVDSAGDHWLACLEAACERMDVEGTSSADAYPVDAALSELAGVPTSGERRPELDNWLDTVDGLSLGCRDVAEGRYVERPVEDSGTRPCVDHPEEPRAPVLRSDRPAPIMTVAAVVARLGEMDATLRLVGEALTRGETVYEGLVSRWTPYRLEVDLVRNSSGDPSVANVTDLEQDAPVARESDALGGDPGSAGWSATGREARCSSGPRRRRPAPSTARV